MKTLKMLLLAVVIGSSACVIQAVEGNNASEKREFGRNLDLLVRACDVIEQDQFNSALSLVISHSIYGSSLTVTEQHELLLNNRKKSQFLAKLQHHGTCQKLVFQLSELESIYKDAIDGGLGELTMAQIID